jgi:hypothetical protein
VAQNAARLAAALAQLGIRPNDPVATFAWNNQEHLEAYFGVPSGCGPAGSSTGSRCGSSASRARSCPGTA